MTHMDVSTLDHLPRLSLAHLPTPLEPLPRFSAELGGPQVWIKRDDLTGLATGGNKTRKLEFLLAQAHAANADCVITAGSTQSNHARQTAAAAAKSGLDCHLALFAPGGEPPTHLSGNLLIDHLLGAHIHWTAERSPYTETIDRVAAALREQGRNPYIIPYGGSNAYGLLGYAVALREVRDQAAEAGVKFDSHVFASSSGGTQAGLLLGAHLTGLALDRILGISVDRQADDLAQSIADLTHAAADLLNLSWRIDPADVAVNDDYLGGGYAVVGEPERDAIQLLARTEGILVDPVYTGRALAGLIDLIQQGAFTPEQRVLFWHTGGTAVLSAFADSLA